MYYNNVYICRKTEFGCIKFELRNANVVQIYEGKK